ncbi:MAG: secretin N-terminal domain-containing protein, partial [Planctomycetota bacterium]
MGIRTLFTAVVGFLFITGLSLSQETTSPAVTEEPLLVGELSPEPLNERPTSGDLYAMETQERIGVSRAVSSGDEMVTKIFMLNYFPAKDLERLIVDIFSIDSEKVHADSRSNRIILQARQKQMNDVEALIEKLDVADSKLELGQAFGNLIYRVYMFEIPPKDQGMKSFTMILQASGSVTSASILNVAATEKIEVSDYVTIDERENEKVEILLQGRAPSNESIQNIAELTGIQIREIKWDDDETFTRNIGAAHYSQLSPQMQKHLQKFLGENIVTVGYWFGSS